jgi:very-short-patch-repair endonuclease
MRDSSTAATLGFVRAPAKTFVRAGRLRRTMSLPEVQLWQALRRLALDGMRVRRQHPIGPFVLDFYVPSAKLAIEVDGAAHDIAAQESRDRARDAWLAARGIRTLRLNARDILDPRHRDDALATIAAWASDTSSR